MTDKELIKQEIERRIDLYSIAEKDDSTFARMGELSSLIDFIDSLPEEPAKEALEEAAEAFYNNCNLAKSSWWDEGILHKMSESKETFIAGAEWYKGKMKEALQTEYEKGRFDMREEMMKTLFVGEVVKDIHNQLSVKSEPLNDTFGDIKFGDKVKIIIIKTKQQ